jgi:prepilin-type N-terminal cleavage/methylation domain-containing protein
MRRETTIRERGITLVEMLVVMVILSMALAVVVPSIGNSYDNWMLRSSGRRTVTLFRLASDVARREGTDLAGYYENHRVVLLRKGSIFKELEIPAAITVRPEKPRGVVFLPTGQILASEPFVLENGRGRRMTVELGPFLGEVTAKESMR